ncbi:MAG: iron-containing redox enzyme family protein [Gammaproteobacteria bacterium]|jgi:pyrroloquinoline quinone (PQQ) biosynthesis protein C|nr:iron-containing redox enzyme family protein [Gammaproteobacteria bacterium]MBT3860840.1 iron-containing redox enzyme family protein [Gammaproteobacteria bacterium]MBT3986905.1 iron-containing redox enzyme family protein [Gammaproteobacteria bacterium]MBT4254954.1 iron-containing redox enzyme family protein [Gammaproteobacteria bacterium]MBT4582114.1 iron-containing redox enzyme family protein [Gammaproteobacteria bacterium]
MTFFETLVNETEQARSGLLSAPIIERCLSKDVSIDDYVGFLVQAYHHVKHTVPLLMAVGSRLPDDKEWLREAVAEYIEEEIGHQEWILNDIENCGYDKEWVRNSRPHPATELMVAYAYDTIQRIDPMGFFGMVYVLEGTSVNLADQVADAVRGAIGLPKKAFSYLYSHGSLDQDHVKFFEQLMDRIDDEGDQKQIVHSCKMFYQLYGDIFRSLSSGHGVPKLSKAA